MNIKKHIPNAITCCNLLCGCLAIVQAMNGHLAWAAYLVGLAAIFDFFDGFAARMLKVSSAIGKDLDSLADMVTFGVVPGIVMYKLLGLINGVPTVYASDIYTGMKPAVDPSASYVNYIAFLIPVLSAVRLAKFNNDPRQSDSFIGLPTPANAIFICGLALVISYPSTSSQPEPQLTGMLWILASYPTLISITVIFSLLLIAELPLFSLKFKHFKFKGNEIRFIFLGLCLIMLAWLQLTAIPLCIVLYILLSSIHRLITWQKGSSR